MRVLIAGGGVAGIEAMLALRALAAGRVTTELLAPEDEFVYRPMAVAEPFGLGEARGFPLDDIVREGHATRRRGALAAVNVQRRIATTTDGTDLEYDVLVVAIGARADEAIPGALTFRGRADSAAFHRLLEELESGAVRSAAFALPAGVGWSLPLYELALMTAARLHRRGLSHLDLTVVTHERAPLELFGGRGSHDVERLLNKEGIRLVTGAVAESAADGRLWLAGGDSIEAERVVALPTVHVPPLPGIPQERDGFIPTAPDGRVIGALDVYAAGDAVWFPIKQGGISTQQADLAAAAIAAVAGADVEPADAPLVLRAALLTGGTPRFLRADVGGDSSAASGAALWWPPGKIAGRYLAPLVARLSREEPPATMDVLDHYAGRARGTAEAGHREALDLALGAADTTAERDDPGSALRWLDVAEQLNVVLPPEYAQRRERWRAELAAAP